MNDYRSYKFRQDNDKLVLIIRKSSAEIIAEDDEIGEGTNPRIYGNHIGRCGHARTVSPQRKEVIR